MKSKISLLLMLFAVVFVASAQENGGEKASYVGKITSIDYVPSIASRGTNLVPANTEEKEAKDGRSSRAQAVIGKDSSLK